MLQQQARLEEALAAYGQAIELRKDYADAINNAGIVLQELGRAGEAIDLYRQLLERMPAHADACNNMGTALLAEGRPDEARAAFEQALTHRPDFPEAFYNLGNAWRELGDLAEAIAAYRNALRLRPDYADAFSQLVYHRAQACDWDGYEADQEKLVDMVRRGVRVPPFYLLSTPASASDQLICARHWIGPIKPPPKPSSTHKPVVERERIRLGYLSGDFHQHATAQLMAELFECHDRDRFEVFAYSYGPDDNSPMRARLDSRIRPFRRHSRPIAPRGRRAYPCGQGRHPGRSQGLHPSRAAGDISLSPGAGAGELSRISRHHGGGFHRLHHRRPVRRSRQPAAVLFGEAGSPSRQLSGERQKARGGERRTSRQDCGLPAEGLVLCSFNNSYKISPAFFDIWMRLLRSVPGSVLWLLEANELVKGNLRSEAEKRGVDPGRLIFAPVVPSAEHLGRHRHADLFLDTLPCNAHTTASDALWAGLPVLTCSGDTFAGRVAGSLLTAVGMPELVTGSLEEYEQTALALARDPQRLIALRQKLQKNRDTSALFDLAKIDRKYRGGLRADVADLAFRTEASRIFDRKRLRG